MTSSAYDRDPGVPPVHVEHLGKHHKTPTASVPVQPRVPAPRPDDGPTYADFLEHDASDRATDELG
ncbi:hypothetical protein [Frondihabitans cladoniiphilus]|uniref:Uncharacterized protein n=1 Tax=Frondihabitans cladoniiphilus TaxID=715785 RepID=A0ABP8W0R4_9MICO